MLLAHLGVERFDLVGHSMGGAVAQQIALEQPQCVERLVLADTLPSFRTDTMGRRLLFATRYAMMGLLGPRRLAGVIARQLFPLPHQHWLRDRTIRRGQANDRGTYLKTIRALVRWSVLDRLDQLTMPVLVLVAEHDYFPVSDAEAFAARLPQAQLKVFAGAHHALPLEVPEEFSTVLLEFLQAGTRSLAESA
jgi:pimeloyl-ACP methyl ester carboxylesterase